MLCTDTMMILSTPVWCNVQVWAGDCWGDESAFNARNIYIYIIYIMIFISPC